MVSLKEATIVYGDETKGTVVFDRISFAFPSKGLIALLGKSGSGKTTLLFALAGFHRPAQGEIIRSEGERFAFVFQDFGIVDGLTAMANACLWDCLRGKPKAEREARAMPVLALLGIETYAKKLAMDLSGGERQRVSLARAMLSQHATVLADEPTGALDQRNAKAVMAGLAQMAKTRLVVMATHDRRLAESFADGIAILDNQSIRWEKQPKEGFRNRTMEEASSQRVSLSDAIGIANGLTRAKRGRMALASVSSGIAFAALGISLSIGNQSHRFGEIISAGYYAPTTVHLSERKAIAQAQGMTLSRLSGLGDEAKAGLSRATPSSFYPSLSYFVPTGFETLTKTDAVSVGLEPALASGSVSQGRVPKAADELVCNAAYLAQLGLTFRQASLDPIGILVKAEVTDPDGDATDVFEKDYRFRIVGVANEPTALNAPVCYYDYRAMLETLKGTEFPLTGLTLEDVLFDPRFQDSDYLGYETLAEVKDPKLAKDWADKQNGTVTFRSRYQDAQAAGDELAKAVSTLSASFVSAAAVIAFFIAGFAIASLCAESRRAYALLYAFSPSDGGFWKLSLGLVLLFFGMAGGAFGAAALGLVWALPSLLSGLGLPPAMGMGSFPMIGLSLLGLFLSSLLACAFPLARMKQSLSSALRSQR